MKIHASFLSTTVALLRRARRVPGLLALALLPCAVAPSATAALLPKVFVSSTGSDTAGGGQTTPKRTFASAITAVQSGGEIVVLDTANYGGMTIAKPLTVSVVPGAIGFVLAGGNANGINVAAGPTDTVTLRGLTFEGGSNASTGGSGINITGGGSVQVENCKITAFGTGILLNADANSSEANVHLVMSNCTVTNCNDGLSVYSNGYLEATSATATGCLFTNLTSTAVYASASPSSLFANVTVSGCTMADNYIALDAAGQVAYITADNCALLDNTYGLYNADNGTYNTFGNNRLANNSTPSTFTNAIGLQ